MACMYVAKVAIERFSVYISLGSIARFLSFAIACWGQAYPGTKRNE